MATLDDVLTSIQQAVIAINNLSQVTNTVHSGLYATSSTVANLPSASSAEGAIRYVTDANSDVRLTVVAGGGAKKVLVFSNATNWLIL